MAITITVDPYEKQNFADGQVLIAEQMNHIEDGIYKDTVNLTDVVSELQTLDNSVSENTTAINLIKDKITVYTDTYNDGNIKIEYGEA